MTITEIVKNKMVKFNYYREGELWYITEDGFEFPVPTSDTGMAVFKAEDKAIFFMRWIRKHLAFVEEWKKFPTYEEMLDIEEKHSPMIGSRLKPIMTPTIVDELFTEWDGSVTHSQRRSLEDNESFIPQDSEMPKGHHPIFYARKDTVKGWVIKPNDEKGA